MPNGLTHPDSRPLAKRLAAYGCTELVPLNEKLSVPEQLNYLDLLPMRSNERPTVSAVAEYQGTALLYLVDASGDVKSDAASLAILRRQLANRSDPAWLGVVKPGALEIFPIGFHGESDTQPVKTIEEKSTTAPLFFQSLVHGTFEENGRLNGTDFVYRKIFDLLTQMMDEFVPLKGEAKLDALEVLSLAGRALFFRFLIDRDIVRPNELHGPEGICPTATELKDAFSTAEKAAATSSWLDATFNGDFLPLIDESIPSDDRETRKAAYLRYFKRTERSIGKAIFTHLHAILRGWRAIGDSIQREFDWGDLDFAHIPVGVLSQVYESFSHRADPRTAKETSVHYTPRTIASLMVDEAFAALKEPANAKVLDSACGAGIFLVLAFRRIVRDRWLKDCERPNTKTIQKILYEQVRGFDISESALRLAALALYITAIELNASPHPPKLLKFPRNLRNEVLYRFGDEAVVTKSKFHLGSLGPEVPKEFDRSFDIVIGNPPWTRLRAVNDTDDDEAATKTKKAEIDALNKDFTNIGRRVLAERGFAKLSKSYENPDNNPDLPFLFRAMEWAKDGAVISLAMHARLFGRVTGNGFKAWIAILKSLQVTGLINGADLRKTPVWEGMDMPFCLFFARNSLPADDHRFYYSAPRYEPGLNGEGRFRIDYESAQPVGANRVVQQPWILKALSLGTWLDVEIVGAVKGRSTTTIAQIWSSWDNKKTGQGYNRSPGQPQNPATFLGPMLDFVPNESRFRIDFSELYTYRTNHGTDLARWPREEAIYQAPLVIIPQSPGETTSTPKAYLSDQPVAYSQSYFGYSCKDHPEAKTLSSLVYLLAHSMLFAYFCLMTSRRSGFDRQTFNKEEFDALPSPDLAQLPSQTKVTMRRLAQRLQHDSEKPWSEINEFIFSLYGLDADAVQIAEDTLFAASSYRRVGRPALELTARDNRSEFISSLQGALDPYFDVCGEHASVREAEFQCDSWNEPWFFLEISSSDNSVTVNSSLMREAMKSANQRGCSRIIVRAPKKQGLLLGLLNQRRWWTITRARLCAQHIIREHLDAFGLKEDE